MTWLRARGPWLRRALTVIAGWMLLMFVRVQSAAAAPIAAADKIGQTPPALAWIDLKDSRGISIWNFEMSLDRGGITSPDKFFWASITDACWGAYRSWCALSLWFLDWVLSFTWVQTIAAPLLSVGNAMQQVVTRLGLVPTFLTLTALLAGLWMLKGRHTTAIWEVGIACVIAALASGVFAQPVQMIAGQNGYIVKANQTGQELAAALATETCVATAAACGVEAVAAAACLNEVAARHLLEVRCRTRTLVASRVKTFTLERHHSVTGVGVQAGSDQSRRWTVGRILHLPGVVEPCRSAPESARLGAHPRACDGEVDLIVGKNYQHATAGSIPCLGVHPSARIRKRDRRVLRHSNHLSRARRVRMDQGSVEVECRAGDASRCQQARKLPVTGRLIRESHGSLIPGGWGADHATGLVDHHQPGVRKADVVGAGPRTNCVHR